MNNTQSALTVVYIFVQWLALQTGDTTGLEHDDEEAMTVRNSGAISQVYTAGEVSTLSLDLHPFLPLWSISSRNELKKSAQGRMGIVAIAACHN
jgi:hypothetical protein